MAEDEELSKKPKPGEETNDAKQEPLPEGENGGSSAKTCNPEPSKEELSRFEKFKMWRDSIALLLAAVGAIYTICTWNNNIKRDQKQETIANVYRIKDPSFLNALVRVKAISSKYDGKKELESEATNDINHLFNAYDNIGDFYAHNVLDQELLRDIICDEVREFWWAYHAIDKVNKTKFSLDPINLDLLNGLCVIESQDTIKSLNRVHSVVRSVRRSDLERLDTMLIEEVYKNHKNYEVGKSKANYALWIMDMKYWLDAYNGIWNYYSRAATAESNVDRKLVKKMICEVVDQRKLLEFMDVLDQSLAIEPTLKDGKLVSQRLYQLKNICND